MSRPTVLVALTDHNPTDPSGNERALTERDLRAQIAQGMEKDDVRWLMESERGRRIVWRLLSNAGVFRSSWSQNALVMAYCEGFRNYGLGTLLSINSACPEAYAAMVQENQ